MRSSLHLQLHDFVICALHQRLRLGVIFTPNTLVFWFEFWLHCASIHVLEDSNLELRLTAT